MEELSIDIGDHRHSIYLFRLNSLRMRGIFACRLFHQSRSYSIRERWSEDGFVGFPKISIRIRLPYLL
jgi:hypothetical protein